jgi:peroxiredoxin
LILAGAGVVVFENLSEVPKVEPAFERIGDAAAGPVKDFALRDAAGGLHTMSEWSGRPAIVLFFGSLASFESRELGDAAIRLSADFGPQGVLFLGIATDTGGHAKAAIASNELRRLPFPVLEDLNGRIACDAGVGKAPEAVVLADDGQIFGRYPLTASDHSDGYFAHRQTSRTLAAALDALVHDELPVAALGSSTGSGHLPTAEELLRASGAETPTFSQHVAPILLRSCAQCHRPGEVAPFSLLTYRDAAKRGSFLHEVVASGKMPPWKPYAGVGVFMDAKRLSVTEIEILKRWAEGGCKPGDLAATPVAPRIGDEWQLGVPDLVVSPSEEFSVPPDGPDIYRSFCVPIPLDRDVTVVGVEFHPGNRRVVHHSRFHVDDSGDARARDREEAGPGFAGQSLAAGRFELPYPGLGAWTPGMTPRLAPSGVGRVIRRGSDIVVQVHYHPSGKPETDRSSIGLFFAKGPTTKTMSGYTLCTDKIDIPAGARRHRILLSTRIKADVHLYTVVPHAHHLCREFRLAATHPDGSTQPLLWITDWDMDWQDQYRFAKPVRLPRGTVLTLAAYFDNSEDNPRNPNKPPKRVRYGIETKDEMCACHLEFLCDDERGQRIYTQKSPFGL